MDHSGQCELIVANEQQKVIYRWANDHWVPANLPWPKGVAIVDDQGRDAGLRFVDIDQDGYDDLLFSNQERYSLHLWEPQKWAGWSIKALDANRADADHVPIISRLGTNNGAWFHSDHMWVQNEDTARLPNLVDRRSYNQLLEPLHGDMPPPKPPTRSLKTMRVPAGLKIELVAWEPLATDPIAFDWGIDGTLWVVQMGDYPLGADGQGAAGGQVKKLVDFDGDGRYDRATVFMDKLNFPTGIKAWKDGVLITAAPDLLFAADTTGDGKADKVEVLFNGFREGNQQHRVNGLRWGLDNWLYLANGDSGGTIKSLKTGKTLNINGRDLRINPETGAMEALSGQTQFGRNRDDWGNWFGGNNSNPMWHYVIEDYVLRRNPHVPAPPVRKQVSQQPGAAPVYPTSRTLTRFNDPARANRFTSACSPIVYRDRYLEQLVGQSFICEPVHNLVHREIMQPNGASFSSQRLTAETDSEFLSSSDSWFRPTMIRTGPDGALWVADMYRLVIEHPEWIPKSWQQRLDLRSGANLGRIYRITRDDDQRPVSATHQLANRTTAQWVQGLQSSNGWQRDIAQQQLVLRNDPAAVKPLQAMANADKEPLTRLHALCTLDGMNHLDAKLVVNALQDPHPGVRRHAARLASQFPIASIEKKLIELASQEKDVSVQLQVAIALGHFNTTAAGKALGQFASRHAQDNYRYAAALSSIHAKNLPDVMQGALAGTKQANEKLLEHLLMISAGLGNRDSVSSLVAEWTAEKPFQPWQIRAVASTLRNLQRNAQKPPTLTLEARKGIERMIQAVHAQVLNPSVPLDQREDIIHLLAYATKDREAISRTLENLLAAQQPLELQTKAIGSILQFHEDGAKRLLQRWTQTTPTLRVELINRLLLETRNVVQLLDAIEKGVLLTSDLDARQRQRLIANPDKTIAARATAILKISPQSDRLKVIEAHQPVASLKGDRERGRVLYRKHCSNCHQLEGVGTAVGPNLAALKVRSMQDLLTAILDPNRAVESKYLEYTALTVDGRQHAGILSRETTADITLRGPQGKQTVILRKNIELLRTSGKSLMPVGVEKDLSHQDLADIIHYLRIQGPAPKSFPGNKPQVVRPAKPGNTIKLTTATCRIYGNQIRLEARYRNLGFWGSAQDRAEWTIELPQPGTYEVSIDFACPQDTAGNPFILTAGTEQLRGTVTATKSWDNYQTKIIGKVSLPAGTSDISFRADGEPKGYLLDLRGIQLTPAP